MWSDWCKDTKEPKLFFGGEDFKLNSFGPVAVFFFVFVVEQMKKMQCLQRFRLRFTALIQLIFLLLCCAMSFYCTIFALISLDPLLP